MSIVTELWRSPVANGGFGDPDLTPKPLRISKREQAGKSTAGTVNSSLSVRKSQTHRNLQTLAPSEESSTRVNSTQLDLSLQDSAAPTSQWTRRNTFLHVHKQRQSEPINTNTAALTAKSKEPIGFSPFNPPARSRDSCPAMSQSGSSFHASRTSTAVRPASTRAFTTGTYERAKPLSPVHEISSSFSASSALREGQRRAVTNPEAFHKDSDAIGSLPNRRIRKKRSSKNGLMSRVMSGLTGRTHASNATPRDRDDASQIPPNISSATPCRAREEMRASRQSSSSTGTDTYCGSTKEDLHHALGAFSTPPTSNATSSPTAGSLNSRPSIRPKRFRDHCTPADAVLMGAELTLTPEYDRLSSEKGRSMLVSLDIKGTTNSGSTIQDVWSQHTGLDVVVVIDNSLQTSPAALMASCETARFLASILNVITDQLAIICTSTTDTSGANSMVVRDLSKVKMRSIKTALDAITISMKKPKPNAWVDTISCAKEILLKSTAPDPDEEPFQDTFGHIFLLTSDADGLSFQPLEHEKLTFHTISPAGAPRNLSSIHCDGWKLRSLSGNEPQAVSKKKDLDPTSVSNRLRVLISQARSGKVLGNLTELVLEVSAGPDCVIENVIGKVEYNEIHPGEVFSVVFKLRALAATVQGYSLSHTPTQSSDALLNRTDVLSQLNKMLGTTDATILTARLTYKHSLLPAGTTCSVTTECHVERRLPDPGQKPVPSNFNAKDCTVLVHQRLAQHLATQGSPRNALTTLNIEFGDRFQLSACPEYINLLAKELKYQARVMQRLEIEALTKKPAAVHANRPLQNIGQRSIGAEKYKDQDCATSDIPTEELFKTKPALAILSLKKSREQLRTDEARKIWSDMRKMKRPPNHIMRGRSISAPLDEARKEGIRDLAFKKKRSIGSDTLRSMFSVWESG